MRPNSSTHYHRERVGTKVGGLTVYSDWNYSILLLSQLEVSCYCGLSLMPNVKADPAGILTKKKAAHPLGENQLLLLEVKIRSSSDSLIFPSFVPHCREDDWDSDPASGWKSVSTGSLKRRKGQIFRLRNLRGPSAAANLFFSLSPAWKRMKMEIFCSTAAPARRAVTAHHRASRLRRHKSAITASLLQILSSPLLLLSVPNSP